MDEEKKGMRETEEEPEKKTPIPRRRRRKAIKPEQVQQRLLEIADRCMEAEPKRVYNKSTRQWEEVGSYEFDAANAIRALTEIGKYLGVADKGEESAVTELRVDFGESGEYAR